MNKILVMGVSPGVGKSTFARELGEILQSTVCHLDRLFWRPGWVQNSQTEFIVAQNTFMAEQEMWIVEGNYTSAAADRLEQADTLIYLELPLIVCYSRVVKRWILNRGKTRPDMGEGCPEKIDWEFLSFIGRTYFSRKRAMRERMKAFEKKRQGNKVYDLRGKREIQAFLDDLRVEKYILNKGR
jgi:adenylate kinase family enzyme